ncbi:unnamed protein product [Didymodactylos carnosus]|uniref:PWWP domain-containing protein n=1 Tax=Didymodactylos carnosus TaxID=1234261 RepID=A0A8S2GHI7_9BILA|nr:unnamed protein product [Didymodactylos carnosus]CAF3518668.1 unnamed protein product [Didymodactylos carnosus]
MSKKSASRTFFSKNEHHLRSKPLTVDKFVFDEEVSEKDKSKKTLLHESLTTPTKRQRKERSATSSEPQTKRGIPPTNVNNKQQKGHIAQPYDGYERPVTRRASRLVSQTNTSTTVAAPPSSLASTIDSPQLRKLKMKPKLIKKKQSKRKSSPTISSSLEPAAPVTAPPEISTQSVTQKEEPLPRTTQEAENIVPKRQNIRRRIQKSTRHKEKAVASSEVNLDTLAPKENESRQNNDIALNSTPILTVIHNDDSNNNSQASQQSPIQQQIDFDSDKINDISISEAMTLGSPIRCDQNEDDSDNSISVTWTGSSKMSTEILKRRFHFPKQEPQQFNRKKAFIPRFSNLESFSEKFSGTPINDSLTSVNKNNINSSDLNPQPLKRRLSRRCSDEDYQPPEALLREITTQLRTAISPLSPSNIEVNSLRNDFEYDYPNNTLNNTMDSEKDDFALNSKPKPRRFAVKSTQVRKNNNSQITGEKQPNNNVSWKQSPIKQTSKLPQQYDEADVEDDVNESIADVDVDDYDYHPNVSYSKKGTSTARRTATRGGSRMGKYPQQQRKMWNDEYDAFDEDEDEESYERGIFFAFASLTKCHNQSYDEMYTFEPANKRRASNAQYRGTSDTRRSSQSSSNERRIAINNGRQPIYKPYKSSTYRPTPATLGLSSSRRNTNFSTHRAVDKQRPIVNTSGFNSSGLKQQRHWPSNDDEYYLSSTSGQLQPGLVPRTSSATSTMSSVAHQNRTNSGNTYVAKINDVQLSEVANSSQIFFVNVPQSGQEMNNATRTDQSQQQQVLSVLTGMNSTTSPQTTDLQTANVLPLAVVQQAQVKTNDQQTLAFTLKFPIETRSTRPILPKPSATDQQSTSKPFSWSRPPMPMPERNIEDESTKKSHRGLTIIPINDNGRESNRMDMDTMEAAHVLASAADMTIAAANAKKNQQDDEMNVDAPIAGEETVQTQELHIDEQQRNEKQNLDNQQPTTITAKVIDDNGVEHTVVLSTEEASQILTDGAVLVDGNATMAGNTISIEPQTYQLDLSQFSLDANQLQAALAQAGIDTSQPLTIEQIITDPQIPGQPQQTATLCTSPDGTQFILTQPQTNSSQTQQYILQTNTSPVVLQQSTGPQYTTIVPSTNDISANNEQQRKHDSIYQQKQQSTTAPKRRFAVKSTASTIHVEKTDDNSNDSNGDQGTVTGRERKAAYATKSTVTPIEDDDEGIVGIRAYRRKNSNGKKVSIDTFEDDQVPQKSSPGITGGRLSSSTDTDENRHNSRQSLSRSFQSDNNNDQSVTRRTTNGRGEVVWIVVSKMPAWPAQIVARSTGCLMIKYFNDDSEPDLVSGDCLKPFLKYYDDYANIGPCTVRRRQGFQQALDDAYAEWLNNRVKIRPSSSNIIHEMKTHDGRVYRTNDIVWAWHIVQMIWWPAKILNLYRHGEIEVEYLVSNDKEILKDDSIELYNEFYHKYHKSDIEKTDLTYHEAIKQAQSALEDSTQPSTTATPATIVINN